MVTVFPVTAVTVSLKDNDTAGVETKTPVLPVTGEARAAVGETVSFRMVLVAADPALPKASVSVALKVRVPSDKPLKSRPVNPWLEELMVPVPVLGVPPFELVME